MSLSTERIETLAGWSIALPTSWVEDDSADSGAIAFVPFDALGRLSIWTINTKHPLTSPEAIYQQALDVARSVGLGRQDVERVDAPRPGQYVVYLRGRHRGRDVTAAVHVLLPAMLVLAAWHTDARPDPHQGNAIAALESILPPD